MDTCCWRCAGVFTDGEPRVIDHDGRSHFACIAQTFDRERKNPDGTRTPRPGVRGLSERWL